MGASITPSPFGDIIVIRYDGMDAERHEIDMALLADSLRGLSRIISVAGNFAATENIISRKDGFVVRPLVMPPQSHCFEIHVLLHWIEQSQLATAVVGGLTVTLVAYICKKAAGDRAEMKHLSGALDAAIRQLGHRDDAVVERMMGTIEKLAESLRPSARLAVAPIGETAQTISIRCQGEPTTATFGAADKEAILSESPVEVGREAIYQVQFTEMDVESGACKVALDPTSDTRVSAKITDPAFAVANNLYVLALAAKTTIAVTAKPTIRDGVIERLFISNTPSQL